MLVITEDTAAAGICFGKQSVEEVIHILPVRSVGRLLMCRQRTDRQNEYRERSYDNDADERITEQEGTLFIYR